ncbi:hypothetical protein LINGRAHAP2_LOCUS33812 [Linum grandiflorum]
MEKKIAQVFSLALIFILFASLASGARIASSPCGGVDQPECVMVGKARIASSPCGDIGQPECVMVGRARIASSPCGGPGQPECVMNANVTCPVKLIPKYVNNRWICVPNARFQVRKNN